jgi:hypothetical protein
MTRVLGILAALLAIGILTITQLVAAENVPGHRIDEVARQVVPSGSETPLDGCLFLNGRNVCDYGDAVIRDTYLREQAFLGDPISSFDSQSQTFVFGRLTYRRGNPDGWRVEWANLGLQHLTAHGYVPQVGAELHPAVHDWIAAQIELGVDTLRVIGRVVSPPVCNRETGMCQQWFDKAVFRFPSNATAGSQVQRLPLGLLSLPVEASAPVRPSGPNLSALVVGAVVLACGLGVVFVAVRRRSESGLTI